jgi:putative ABC transport system permease protein
VVRFPNISAVDAAVVLEALDAVLARVAFAIRFMAAFTIASGLIILTGAISTSRYQRARESVLLRTLGAPGQTIRRILATEYLALGLLAAVAGVSLACVAAWALMHFLFEQGLVLPVADLALIVGLTSIVTATIGLLSSRDALKRTPLAGIREIADAQ